MLNIERGFRGKLEQYINEEALFEVAIKTKGRGEYDSCCFGVDKNGKLSDDRYMIFYNQLMSPNDEISLHQAEGVSIYKVNLSKLSPNIQKLVFTVSIDGDSVMGDIENSSMILKQNGEDCIVFNLSATEFRNEKAIILFELYIKDVWRISAIGRGFDGGLSKLLELFGGEEDQKQTASEPIKKISLEKIIAEKAPELVSLVKPLKVSLEKHNLQSVAARVGLVVDMSGSMTARYRDGTVQDIINKTLPLALQFDDDGRLDAWLFGERPLRLPDVTIENYQQTIPSDWKSVMKSLVATNNEPAVMEKVIDEYKNSEIPVYVLFISDGGVSQKGKITKLIKESATMPIFWQFVGISSSPNKKQRVGAFGVLEALDTMEGRYVDNAGFFSIDDFASITNDELYERLLGEFTGWLKVISEKGMI